MPFNVIAGRIREYGSLTPLPGEYISASSLTPLLRAKYKKTPHVGAFYYCVDSLCYIVPKSFIGGKIGGAF